MDHAQLIEAGIDCEKGIERCMGNVTLYARLLTRFLDDSNMAGAYDCMLVGDYDGVYAHLHELKGVSGNLGIENLFDEANAILRLLRDEQYEKLPMHFERLSSAYDQAIDAIRGALG